VSVSPRPWPALLTIGAFGLLTIGVGAITHNAWLILAMAVMTLGLSAMLTSRYMNSQKEVAILERMNEALPRAQDPIAYRLLAELAGPGQERKSITLKASEVVIRNLFLEKFVIFFRDNDRYWPSVFGGLNKNNLNSPAFHQLSHELKHGMQTGAISFNDDDVALAFRHNSPEGMESPVAFAFSWARSRSVFVIADDRQGFFAEQVKNAEFNSVFWPGLEHSIKINHKLQEMNEESKQASQQLDQARMDIAGLNKELKSKLVDLQAFVKISSDLYSLFNEEQLFQTLKDVVCSHVGASFAEILVPDSEGRFVIKNTSTSSHRIAADLTLGLDSELSVLLTRSSRPVLLPLVGSGLKRDEPFLGTAIGAGIQVATAIKINDQTSFMLLLGEKQDNSLFTNFDLDYLFVISNIASLAMENIHQYSTIEKLSYTDSMTGVFNYRYFYKRLSEEVLRAKRYERELALVILDIDNFKLFNDNYGHQAGDLVLKQLSDLITRTIRSIDVVSRYGGEEFCIIMPDTGEANCSTFIERLRLQIADFKFESNLFDRGNSISVSVGGAVYPLHAPAADRLIYCADMALLKAKSLGRNRAVMFQPDLSLETKPVDGGLNESHQETIF